MKQNISVHIMRLAHGEGLTLPFYASDGAAGADIRAAVAEDVVLPAGEHRLIPTGFCMAIPEGFEAQVRPRSGLALRYGVTVLNSPGTIDADYRGEVGVILINHGTQDFVVQRGARIAQLLIAPVIQAHFQTVTRLDETQRGHGGFGSSGEH